MNATVKDVHEIVEKHLSEHQTQLEKVLNLQFKQVNAGVATANAHLAQINGRVDDSERAIRGLQENRLTRTTDCPFKTQVDILTEKYLKDLTVEEYTRKQVNERDMKEQKLARSFKVWSGFLALTITVITFLINYVFR